MKKLLSLSVLVTCMAFGMHNSRRMQKLQAQLVAAKEAKDNDTTQCLEKKIASLKEKAAQKPEQAAQKPSKSTYDSSHSIKQRYASYR